MNEKMATISLIDLTGTKNPFGNQKGKEVLRLLSDFIDQDPAQLVYGLSLEGIEATDASFPRESIAALAKQYREDKGFYLQDFGSRDLIDNWHYAAEAKGQPLVIWDKGKFQFIGPDLSPSNWDIVNYIYENGQATTATISSHLDISVQNASTKLKRLFSEGYILRIEETAETGGKEFIYVAIKPI